MKLRPIDFITPARWKSVLTWILKKLLRKLDKSSAYLEMHEIEQLHFRMLSCPECALANTCTHCGCAFTGRINSWEDHCSDGKWGRFFDKEHWENYKKEYGLEFFMTAKFTTQDELRRIKHIINNYIV